ncbi:MAG: MFS family permease [Myxococcota bacterium]|jgi:MFS family permease
MIPAAMSTRNLRLLPIFSALSFTPVFVPVIVLFWEESGLSTMDIYLLQGLFALWVVLLEVPTGMVADRMGKRASLLAAQVIIAVGFCGYGFADSFLEFLLVEVVIALGASLLSGADSALLFDSLQAVGREAEFTDQMGRNQGIRMLSFAASTLLGGFVAMESLRMTMWLSAVGPAVAAVVVWLMVDVKPVEARRSMRSEISAYRDLIRSASRFVWRHQEVRWLVLFLSVLTGSAGWLLWMYQPYMAHIGLPVWAFGVAFAVYNLFAAFSSRQADRFEKRLGPGRVLVGLALLQILPLPLMASLIGGFSFLFVLGHQAVRGLARPIISGRIMGFTEDDKRATVLSMVSMLSRLFFAITAPLIGFVNGATTLSGALWIQAGLLVGVLVVVGVLRPNFRGDGEE